MALNEKKIKEIFEKHKQSFTEMEHYDRTKEKLWGRKRIYITLNQRVLNNFKEIRRRTGKPISRIIEELATNIVMKKNKKYNIL